jgi:hypothetical protein
MGERARQAALEMIPEGAGPPAKNYFST